MFNRRDDFGDYFYYDETSPTGLRWNIDVLAGRKYATVKFARGAIAGGRGEGKQYYSLQLKGVTYTCHRIVYELCHGDSSGCFIDHINQKKWDNRSENLRAIPRDINHRNFPLRADSTSGVTGVSLYHKNKDGVPYYIWRGRVSLLNGKRCSKDFSVNKYGHDVAFELAKVWRKQQIDLLNNEGAGYSDLHGGARLQEDITPFHNNGFVEIETTGLNLEIGP